MFEPIEFPEFHNDVKLQQQLNELETKYSKLQSTKKILWTAVIVFGGYFIISLFALSNIRFKFKAATPQKKDDEKSAN